MESLEPTDDNPQKQLPYNPALLERELAQDYICTSDDELQQMLQAVGVNHLDELFQHIPEELTNLSELDSTELLKPLDYDSLILHLQEVSKKNHLRTSFIGHALKNYKVPSLIPFVCNIRGLTTAYTPYQPERSQGTLQSLWMYSSCLSMLTGFEAINASLYDRSTCLFEACQSALRLNKKGHIILLSEGIYRQDREVLETLVQNTPMKLVTIPLGPQGITDGGILKELVKEYRGKIAALAFMQVNALGLLENVHELTDVCRAHGIQSMALFDPIHLASKGLIPPSQFGKDGHGVDMIVGEGQHLGTTPNCGGPGLGIFGIRFNPKTKTAIRSTAGRYVGKGVDIVGNEALCMVLSTREQHIRREKATSNICSNQSFLATLAGAGILARGEEGMSNAYLKGISFAQNTTPLLTAYKEVSLAFPDSIACNEICLELSHSVPDIIRRAGESNLHLGVDVSSYAPGRNLLLISFTDIHSSEDIHSLKNFFAQTFTAEGKGEILKDIPAIYKRRENVGLPHFSEQELKDFYTKLGKQNISPDDNIYPLGSCTMKYNPYINDWAASLPGFGDVHPEAPVEDIQGSLEILFSIQQMFCEITGLDKVTTQPVAGAQGELVGLKMFQAYHRDFDEEGHLRDVLLIPASAHGTNPATATVAGIKSIVIIKADSRGQIDFEHLSSLVNEYGKRIIGMMVTNPNTSGIFEEDFKKGAELIHSVGGLVYMDGANMNAIAGRVNLKAMGVDAVHNNLHKTWTIPHGGGGPGDAIVAVGEKLKDYLPGIQVFYKNGKYGIQKPLKSIGSFHRHFGNFAHKVRCYTYLKALGAKGIRRMSGIAVLSSVYLYHRLKNIFPCLPAGTHQVPRMHEFILTLTDEMFAKAGEKGISKPQLPARVGKLFLDFGVHAPTVAFPEVYGLMVEPTESFSKKELDGFVEICQGIADILLTAPELLHSTPHFTPVRRLDEVHANKNLCFYEKITVLPEIPVNRRDPRNLSVINTRGIIQEMHQIAKKEGSVLFTKK